MPKPKKKKSNLKKGFFYLCSCCATVIVLLIAGFNLESYLTQDRVLGTKVEKDSSPENEEKIFWKSFLKKNPEYFDGWVELARIYDEEGNSQAKENALKSARGINPNSPVFLP